MATYTADAVALLVYLVDSLPRQADQVFAEAEAGETIIQAPSTALAEVFYAVSRDRSVRGIELTGTAEEARRALIGNGPVSLAPIEEEDLEDYTALVGEFNIHDGLIVASHRARNTEAVITTDRAIEAAGVPTIWG
ncbi:MAG: hypothetical protein U5J98_11020 [Halobacteriales archaeon]|nr:hypothetical protein [Halobacteriales archaeon]